MADSFRASFVLALKDDLSSGLRHIMADVRRLRDLAKSVGFKPLEGADAIVNRVDRDVQQLNRDLGTTARQAETATGAIRRMSAAELGRVREQAAQARRSASLGARIAGGATLEQLYGPGGIPLMRPGARFEPSEEGPVSQRGWRGRMGNAWQRTRERVGGAGEQVGLMGSIMAGISLSEPIHAAAELDQSLRQIAIMQGKHGDAADAEINRLRGNLASESLENGQPVQRLAEAYKDLINRGMPSQLVDQLIPIHGRAATAYGVDTESMGQAVSALSQSLKIGAGEMEGALAAMAQATHEGAFNMTAMSHFMPTIASRMDMLGMTGRGSLDKAAAALEVVSKDSGDPSQTATNFTDMMIAMTQPYAKKAFHKHGIDLQKIMTAAEKAGQDPMEAYIGILERMTRNVRGDVNKAFVLGSVLHNQQAGTAALALLQHRDDYIKLRDELHSIGADKLQRDYDEAMRGLMPQLMVRAAKIKAIEQELGLGFAWTVPVSSWLLGGVVVGMNWLDSHLPGVTTGAIGLTGGMLGLVATMGVLGTVAGPVKAGFALIKTAMAGVFSANALRLLVSPWLALPLLIGSAVVWIWRHWDKFGRDFRQMWAGLTRAASGFGDFIEGALSGDMRRASRGLTTIWDGVRSAWVAVWRHGGPMEAMFGDFDAFLGHYPSRVAGLLISGFRSIFSEVEGVFRDAIAGWQRILNGLSWTPRLPDHLPSLAPSPDDLAHPPTSPDGHIDPPASPDGATRPGPRVQRRPTAYEFNGAPPVQRIHVTFEADVPGRAAVQHRDTVGARGPMLIRT